MYRLYKQRVVVVVIILFLLFAYVLYRLLTSDLESRPRRDPLHETVYCSIPVTFIIRDVEVFQHDLRSTVISIRQKYLKCDLLILPDTLLYPPLVLPHDYNVKVLPQDFSLREQQNSRHVDNLIRTEYALIVPDGIRVEPDSIQELVEFAKLREVKIVAVGVEQHLGNCVQVNTDLKRWTLTFSPGEMDLECDAFPNDIALLVHKSVLASLSDPFARPFNQAFYAQTKLRDIKIARYDDLIIQRPVKLYKDIHARWKRNLAEKERRKLFYQKSGIKKAEYANGDVEWFGCDKTTPRCFATIHESMPDYLYRGRWTPPCCLKALRETARYVFKILEEAGVRYWLEGGSLLGAARHKDIIPWDYDVDIGIYREDIVKCEWLKNSELQALIDDRGFVWEKAKEGDYYRVHYSETNRLHVDLFPFYPKNGIMTKDTWMEDHRQDCEFPEQYLKPLTKIDFVGAQVAAPNSVKEFLEFKFGVGVVENPEYPNPAKKTFDPTENG